MPAALDIATVLPDYAVDEGPPSLEETVRLLKRIQAGDEAAVKPLLDRVLPRMRRWAHGRLPNAVRPMLATEDVVYVVAHKAVRQFSQVSIERSAQLGHYLREAIMNEIRSHWRRVDRLPLRVAMPEGLVDPTQSALDRMIGKERVERYEQAFARLSQADQEAIIGRIDLGYSHHELADYLGKSSSEAARLAVYRAVKNLAELIRRG